MNGYGLKTFAREIKYSRNHITGARIPNCAHHKKLSAIGTKTFSDCINPCIGSIGGPEQKRI